VDEYCNFKISVVISVSGTEILKPLEFPGEWDCLWLLFISPFQTMFEVMLMRCLINITLGRGVGVVTLQSKHLLWPGICSGGSVVEIWC
jgi:hypothetical protein